MWLSFLRSIKTRKTSLLAGDKVTVNNHDRNCAVRERTADEISVGRCWFYTNAVDGQLVCPRHGDVTSIQKEFSKTASLGEDPR